MKVYVLCSGEPDSEIYGVFPTEDKAIEWAARNGPPPNNRHVVEAELHDMIGDMAIKHLIRLTNAGYEIYRGSCDDKGCHYCHGEERLIRNGPDVEFRHEPDCDYVAAKEFLAQLSTPTAADAPPR